MSLNRKSPTPVGDTPPLSKGAGLAASEVTFPFLLLSYIEISDFALLTLVCRSTDTFLAYNGFFKSYSSTFRFHERAP